MLVVIQTLIKLFRTDFQKAKPFTLHCSLLLLVLFYAFCGGFIFNKLEAKACKDMREREKQEKTECVIRVLSEMTSFSADAPFRNETANVIMTCFEEERDERSEWSFVTATLYGFGIVTTLGYNRIAPVTYAGRLFCIVYGICGIPITMIIIANVGQYLNNFAGDSRRKLEAYRTQRRMSKASLSGKEYKESSIQVTSLILLLVFLLYVAFGAILLPALNGQIDFFNGLYYNFLCLTAIDFGQLVPTRVAFLPITFLYVCLGLAITTIAIDIGSEYMKKLHYLGKKMKDAAQTKIWFGGKTLKVRDLLHAVGKKCGVEPAMIDALDLENVVERTIALKEGRQPPEDTNDFDMSDNQEPLPDKQDTLSNSTGSRTPSSEHSPFLTQKSVPELIIRNPSYTSLPHESASPVEPMFVVPAQMCQIELPEYLSDDMEEEEAHIIVVEPPPSRVDIEEVKPVMIQPVKIIPPSTSSSGSMRSRSASPDEHEPKKFREKKEKYGRDARKLYETYQEEWGRLERLSDKKHGPRRKSIMQFTDRSPSPNPHQQPGDI